MINFIVTLVLIGILLNAMFSGKPLAFFGGAVYALLMAGWYMEELRQARKRGFADITDNTCIPWAELGIDKAALRAQSERERIRRIKNCRISILLLFCLSVSLIAGGFIASHKRATMDKDLQRIFAVRDFAEMKEAVCHGQGDHKADQVLRWITDTLNSVEFNSTIEAQCLSLLCDVMKNDKSPLRWRAADAVYSVTYNNIVLPVETNMVALCKKLASRNPSGTVRQYRLAGPKGKTARIFNDHLPKELTYEKPPSVVAAMLDAITELVFVEETRKKVGTYAPSSAGAYVIHWRVWLVDIKRREITAFSEFVGGDPPQKTLSHAGASGTEPREAMERWIQELPRNEGEGVSPSDK